MIAESRDRLGIAHVGGFVEESRNLGVLIYEVRPAPTERRELVARLEQARNEGAAEPRLPPLITTCRRV
jgi:hypothetical protein